MLTVLLCVLYSSIAVEITEEIILISLDQVDEIKAI